MKVLRLTAEFEAGDITPGDAIMLFDAPFSMPFLQRSGAAESRPK